MAELEAGALVAGETLSHHCHLKENQAITHSSAHLPHAKLAPLKDIANHTIITGSPSVGRLLLDFFAEFLTLLDSWFPSCFVHENCNGLES